MDIMLENWLFPRIIKNPHLEEDIEKFLSQEVLELYKTKTQEQEEVKIVNRLVDVLEFVDHLIHIRTFLSKYETGQKIDGAFHSNITFDGHDYSGYIYDCDALILYLLVSAIETCSNHEAISIEDYIVKEYKENTHNNLDSIIALANGYFDEKENKSSFNIIFTTISETLQDELIANIIAFKKKKKGKVYTIENIRQYVDNWEKMNKKEKLKKIASSIYSIRSAYTHHNSRFSISKVSFPHEIKGGIIVKDGFNLENHLKKVVNEACIARLKGNL